MAANRDSTLDIAKGLCILLMVVGHSGCPDYLHDFLYMFHMPCFFFISGRLFKDRYLDDMKNGLWQKVKGLYWPFVKWQMIFLILHNLFVKCHYYEDWLSLPQFLHGMQMILRFHEGCEGLGVFWFLNSLFLATLYAMVFLYILKKGNRLTLRYISGGVILLLLVVGCRSGFPFRLPSKLNDTNLMATAFFLTGYMSNRVVKSFVPSWRRSLGCFILPAGLAIYYSWEILQPEVPVMFYFAGCLGTMGVLHFSSYVSRFPRIKLAFAYLGERTMSILIFHCLGFKLLSTVYVWCNHLPVTRLIESHTLHHVPHWLWIFYVIAAMAFSLAMDKVIKRIIILFQYYKQIKL
jgi:fucose 4-O-acetylase-like acetyltransferase